MRRAALRLLQWTALGALCGVACGAASALFLWLLDVATTARTNDVRLVYALPLAGALMGLVIERIGQPIAGGNNLVIDTIHDDGPELPLRMAPMVLIGTVLTHLFGGSAGREGTAVQMGASLSDFIAHRLRLAPDMRRQLVAAGVAGGFGSVFGTPIAGTVFGLELVVLGRIEYRALVPALVASTVGDMTTRALGIGHTAFPTVAPLALTPLVVVKWLAFAAAIALVTVAFVELTHIIKARSTTLIPRLPLRMAMGGALVVALFVASGTSDYLGLGVPTIERAFVDDGISPFAFAAKLVFTAFTIGTGFMGGEVTPLFFIGATLGHALAAPLGLPLALAAGVGMATVFGAAANTPLALAIMAAELMGVAVLPHAMLVVVVAYVLTGRRGIYPAQRVHVTKSSEPLPAVATLAEHARASTSRDGSGPR